MPAASSSQVEVQVLCELDANGFLRFSKAFRREALPPAAPSQQEAGAAAAEATPDSSPLQQQRETNLETEAKPSDAEEGDAAQPANAQIPSPSFRLTELSLTSFSPPGTYSAKDFLAFREAELAMDNEDRVFREKQERLNALEALVYRLRSELEEGTGVLFEFVQREEADALQRAVDAAENWVYDHQDDPALSKSAVCAEISKLEALAQKPEWRRKQREERTAAADALRQTVEVSVCTGAGREGPA